MQVRVNRIIEIDADTEREGTEESFLYIRWIERTDKQRSRQPDKEINLEADLLVITSALTVIIIEAERQGIFKDGEAIQRAIMNLQNMYVDATLSIEQSQQKPYFQNNVIGREITGD